MVTSAVRVLVSAGLLLVLVGCETSQAWPEDTPFRCRVRTASADLACEVKPDGVVESCRVIRETPSDCGFGAAALDAAKDARLSPSSNPPAGNSTVQFTVCFQPPRRPVS